ncbi:MAG: hypothetical protein IKJ99_03695 [Oscillospiraceae bacterium]|nr:hypothetical protein [Oscillospiraceae bacterium]
MEEDKKYDTEAVKARLEEYVAAEEDIDREIERLEYLTSKMTSISSQVMTGMPRATSASTDRMADMLGRKEELEESIKASVAKQAEERKSIEKIIRHLSSSEERAVIRLRYLDRTDWNDVLEVMFGLKPDFDDKFESYRRRMYRSHGTALINMAKYIKESGEPNTAISTT